LARNVETTAAYWEARIKTYGFHRLTNLCLFELAVEELKIPLMGHALCQMGEEGIPLVLTFSQATRQGLSACFIVPRLFEGLVRTRLQDAFDPDGDRVTRRVFPAEVVFFYGPHFGDRYGIAEAALQSLAGGGIHPVATACSGSCVYLVLAEGQSSETVHVLSQAFEIPRALSQKLAGGKQA
jgi:hypothetical protein